MPSEWSLQNKSNVTRLLIKDIRELYEIIHTTEDLKSTLAVRTGVMAQRAQYARALLWSHSAQVEVAAASRD